MASKLLAAALFLEGMWVQSFPAFGVERRGAPVTAFLRVASERILLRCEVTEPNDLIVLDPTLIDAIDVTTVSRPGDHSSSTLRSRRSITANSPNGSLWRPWTPVASPVGSASDRRRSPL